MVDDGVMTDGEELVLRDADLVPHRARALLDLVGTELIVARRHWRVGGERRGAAHLGFGVGVRHAAGDVLAHALGEHEGRVALVGMPCLRLDAKRAQDAHATDAEQPLLPEAQRGSTCVELREQRPIVDVILLELGVEEVDGHASDIEAPGADVHVAAEGADGGEVRHASRSCHGGDRRE